MNVEVSDTENADSSTTVGNIKNKTTPLGVGDKLRNLTIIIN